MHAQVGELEARRAELLAQLGPLLTRHEQLTRSLPWHKQQVPSAVLASLQISIPGSLSSSNNVSTYDHAYLRGSTQRLLTSRDSLGNHCVSWQHIPNMDRATRSPISWAIAQLSDGLHWALEGLAWQQCL